MNVMSHNNSVNGNNPSNHNNQRGRREHHRDMMSPSSSVLAMTSSNMSLNDVTDGSQSMTSSSVSVMQTRSCSVSEARRQNRERVKAMQREQMEQRRQFHKLKAAGGVNPNVVLQFPLPSRQTVSQTNAQ